MNDSRTWPSGFSEASEGTRSLSGSGSIGKGGVQPSPGTACAGMRARATAAFASTVIVSFPKCRRSVAGGKTGGFSAEPPGAGGGGKGGPAGGFTQGGRGPGGGGGVGRGGGTIFFFDFGPRAGFLPTGRNPAPPQ